MQLRQGDVFLTVLDTVPTLEKQVKAESSQLVLARGEVTGHIHAIHASRAKLYQTAIGLVLVVARAARLRHGDPAKAWKGDHGDVNVPPGKYRVTIDREYEPSGWRKVLD